MTRVKKLIIGAVFSSLSLFALGEEIHDAARIGDLAKVQALVETVPSAVGKRDQSGRTPLHWACRGVHQDVVVYLITQGADVNARDAADVTPLHSVASRGHFAAAKALVEAGARLDARMNDGSAPLHIAAAQGHKDLAVFLMEKGGPLELQDGREDTPLSAAAWNDKWEVVDSLVSLLPGLQKAVLDMPDFDGNRLLHLAARAGRLETMKLLTSKAAGLDERNALGQTAFNLAEEGGFEEVAAWLSGAGAARGPQEFPKLSGPYLGQSPPGAEPTIFAKGVVSKREGMYGTIVFSPDGREAVWRPESRAGILFIESEKDLWSTPRPFSPTAGVGGTSFPFFSLDGRRVYFTAGTANAAGITEKEIIRFAEKIVSGWSEPKDFDPIVNSRGLHWQFSMDKAGNVYFSGPGGINCARFENGRYLPPEPLPHPINEPHGAEDKYRSGEIGPFVSPRGDYLIYSKFRAGRPSQLFISFMEKDGSWSEPRNLSEKLRTEGNDSMAMVTPDGKYLFFQSVRRGSGASRGLYWVDARVIEEMRPGKS